jgi:hypothetical protein
MGIKNMNRQPTAWGLVFNFQEEKSRKIKKLREKYNRGKKRMEQGKYRQERVNTSMECMVL